MTGNVNFRRMFDPRLTEEYCGLAGMPWSDQDGSGEIAGMAIGASLWGLNNQANETGSGLTKAGKIGCQYGYVNLTWMPGSRVFDKAGASGLRVADWQNVIMVNMIGKRFYDETGNDFPGNQYNQIKNYVPHSPISIRRTSNTRPTISSTRRWPAFRAIRTTAAARSGRSSMPMRSRARNGIRSTPWVDIAQRLLLQREHARRARRQDQDEIPAHADAAGGT